MKILLVQKFSIIEPLGLMVIGKAMIDKGHEVEYFLYQDKWIHFPFNLICLTTTTEAFASIR